MYLASLTINNFRRIKSATIEFEPGLNIIVSPNNIGKTAVVDALRSLLAGTDDPYVALTRARDLFVLGIPSKNIGEFAPKLDALGFTKAGGQ